MNKIDLTQQLKDLGLNEKQVVLYLELIKHSRLTPLELARLTKINRTTIYRQLEELKEKGLVEEILDEYKTMARAVSPEKLQLLISTKEAELEKIKKQLPALVNQLSVFKDQPSSNTDVVYFRGLTGLKQLLWNTLKATTPVLGYGYKDWNAGVGREFAEKIRTEVVRRQIFHKEILNISAGSKFTDVPGYFNHYQGRVLPKSVVEINHDTYIYSHVFAFYHLYRDELFGIEIHNAEIAKTQKQIFEVLWKMGEKIN